VSRLGYVNVHFKVPFTFRGYKEEESDKYTPLSFAVDCMVGTNYSDSALYNSIVEMIKHGKEREAYDTVREFGKFMFMGNLGIKRWPLTKEDIDILKCDPELDVIVTDADVEEY